MEISRTTTTVQPFWYYSNRIQKIMEKIKLLTDYKLCKDTDTALDTLKNIDSNYGINVEIKAKCNVK